MKNCDNCGKSFDSIVVIDGIKKYLGSKRKNCLSCCPFGNKKHFNLSKSDEKTKMCSVCKNRFDRKMFYTYRLKKSGYISHSPQCKSCYKQIENMKNIDVKIKLVEYKGGQCERCGYNKSIAALEFHHRDPNQKEFSIAKGKSRSIDKLKLEVDKCDLLCSNCHQELHFSYNYDVLREGNG